MLRHDIVIKVTVRETLIIDTDNADTAEIAAMKWVSERYGGDGFIVGSLPPVPFEGDVPPDAAHIDTNGKPILATTGGLLTNEVVDGVDVSMIQAIERWGFDMIIENDGVIASFREIEDHDGLYKPVFNSWLQCIGWNRVNDDDA